MAEAVGEVLIVVVVAEVHSFEPFSLLNGILNKIKNVFFHFKVVEAALNDGKRTVGELRTSQTFFGDFLRIPYKIT